MPKVFDYLGTDTGAPTVREAIKPLGKTPDEMHQIVNAEAEREAQAESDMQDYAVQHEFDGLNMFVGQTWRQESLLNAAWDKATDFSQDYDPAYDPKPEIDQALPDWAKETLSGALNAKHMEILKERVQSQLDYNIAREYHGGAGMAVGMASMLINPETIALGVGEAATLTKLGYTGIKRVLAGAAIGGLSNTGQELALMANDKSRDELGLLMAAATGTALGGLVAAIPVKSIQETTELDHRIAIDWSSATKHDLDVATGKYKLAPADPAPPIQWTPEFSDSLENSFPRIRAYTGPLKSMGAQGMASKNPVERMLHALTLENAAGTGGKVTAVHSAALDATMNVWRLQSKMNVERLNAFKDWKTRLGKKSMPWDDKHLVEFDEAIATELGYRRHGRNRPAGYKPDPAVKRAADAYSNAERIRFKLLKDNGVEGYENASFDPNHVSRKWDPTKLNRISKERSPEFVKNLIKNAILAGDEFSRIDKYGHLGAKLTARFKQNTAKHMADAIYSRFMRRPTTPDIMRASMLTKTDKAELERRATELITKFGADDADVAHLMAAASDKDARMLDETLRQIDLDVNFDIDGVAVKHLTDNDFGRSLNTDYRRAAGRAAMAKKGFKSQDDFLEAVEEAGRWEQKNTDHTKDVIEANTRRMQAIWKVVLGENIEDAPSSATARSMRLLRKMATLSSMNQVGFAQAAEVGRLAGNISVRNFFKQIPELLHMRRQMTNGKFKDAMLNDIEAAFDVRIGDNHLLDHPMIMADAGGFGIAKEGSGMFMKGLDTLVAKGLHAQGYINGMNMIMRTQHRMHARGFFTRMYQEFTEGMSPARMRRYHDLGLNASDIKQVTDEMRKYAETTTGWYGQTRLSNLNLTKFSQNLQEKLALTYTKAQSSAIQRNLPGETGWFMEKTFGKLLTQFRTFPIVAMEKQTIHDLKHMDLEAFSTLTFTMGAATMAYMAKTYANSFGMSPSKRKKYLKNRLSTTKIGAGATAWAGQFSLMPETMQALGSFGLVNPWQWTYAKGNAFRQGDLGLDAAGPGASMLNSAFRFASGMSSAVLRGDTLADDALRHGVRMIPYSNAIGMRNLSNLMLD